MDKILKRLIIDEDLNVYICEKNEYDEIIDFFNLKKDSKGELHPKYCRLRYTLEENLPLIYQNQEIFNTSFPEWFTWEHKSEATIQAQKFINLHNINGNILKTYYDSGEIKKTIPYKSGKIHGEVVKYNRDGSIRRKDNYLNGKLDGKTTVYHDNGEILCICNYKNGLKHGTEAYYSQKGNIQLLNFYKNGEKHGVCRTFRDYIETFPDNLYEDMIYENGNIIIYKKYSFFKDGIWLWQETKNIDNVCTEIQYRYDDKKEKETITNTETNYRIEKRYYKNGILKKETTYIKDTKQKVISYHKDGSLKYDTGVIND